jgi:thiol-disulfide isomerase/thioredoxin
MAKLFPWKNHALVLFGIFIISVILYQFVPKQEGMQNDFTGLTFFTIEQCGHCKKLKPTIEKLKSNYGSKIEHVDCSEPDDATKAMMEKYSIKQYPTILLFKNGNMIEEVENRDYDYLESLLK